MSLEAADVYGDRAEGELHNATLNPETADFYNARALVWAVLAVAAATEAR